MPVPYIKGRGTNGLFLPSNIKAFIKNLNILRKLTLVTMSEVSVRSVNLRG